ncbi:UPF0280 family protein [Reyranella sp.]|uniref:UPF0280 family protein n=1 Tax=Reyranella sp. TaxID=1929291 RepID=UPI003D0DB07B
MSAVAARFADGRLHLQHGPIDLIVEAFGAADEVERAYAQAIDRFGDILPTLVGELPVLRRPVGEAYPLLQGPVARRMAEAVWPHRARYITPMAAVAGAVADEMLQALVHGRTLAKAYVNDGGDIAIHLTPGHSLRAGIVAGSVSSPFKWGSAPSYGAMGSCSSPPQGLTPPSAGGLVTSRETPTPPHLNGEAYDKTLDGVALLTHERPVRGIATSGRGGRSFSLGIAESVTVLAATAAAADAAATMIANEVNADHPFIERRPACSLDPDSDLGELLVTDAVGDLPPEIVAVALDRGRTEARRLRLCGLIDSAALSLDGQWRIETGGTPLALSEAG